MFRLFRSGLVAGLCFSAVIASRSQAFAMGGSDVGGGGAIDLPLATIDQIATAVDQSKMVLKLWLNGEEILTRTNKVGSSARSKIFVTSAAPTDHVEDIFDVLDHLQIEFRRTTPCLDQAGNEHDGSVYSSIGGNRSICISGLRLAQKLRQDDYDFQTAALILHEASHLMGTSEPEAQELQALAVRGIRSINFDNTRAIMLPFIWGYQDVERRAATIVLHIKKGAKLHDPSLYKELVELSQAFTLIHLDINYRDLYQTGIIKPFVTPLSLLPLDRVWNAFARIHNVVVANCDSIRWKNCSKTYESIFKGEKSVTAQSFFRNESQIWPGGAPMWPTNGNFVSEQVPRISTMKELVQAVDDIRADNKSFLEEVIGQDNEEPFVVQDDGKKELK